jgi:hypothetical protein
MLLGRKYMKKVFIGIFFGAIAGIVDSIPMILQKLTWDAITSAFVMWVIIGFLISINTLKITAITKGILVSFLVLIPSAILIGAKEPSSLLPIGVMTLVLGGALGFSIDKFHGKG